jgi:uncharacterized protein (DUF2236 family)
VGNSRIRQLGRDENGSMPKGMRDIAGEAVLLVGGARAILLQIANPAVGMGVARHSDFASDPMRRLRNTLTYIYVIVYGAADDRATLYNTAITVHESVFGPLAPDDADALYSEYSVLGTALQMPPELWPDGRAAFRNYWNSQLAQLRVTDETRRVARDLLHSRAIPWWLRAGMPLARLVTAGLLTPTLRVAFELPWDMRTQRRYKRAMRVVAAVYPRLPRSIRHWPMRHYLRLFRA